MNKYILGILKEMTKNPNIRKTETWTESKKEVFSILIRKIRKPKVDDHIHSWVSWLWFSNLTFQQNTFPDKSNWLCYLLLE